MTELLSEPPATPNTPAEVRMMRQVWLQSHIKGIVTRFAKRRQVSAQEEYPVLKMRAVQILFTEKVLEAMKTFHSEFILHDNTGISSPNYNNELSEHLDVMFDLFLKFCTEIHVGLHVH